MKKILIIAAVVLLASCKKEMISETTNQDDLKKYAELANGALLLKANGESAMQMAVKDQTNGIG